MTWTDTLPTVPGWYWHRAAPADAPQVRQVRVWPGNRLVVCDFPRSLRDGGIVLLNELGGQWWGPLAAPGE